MHFEPTATSAFLLYQTHTYTQCLPQKLTETDIPIGPEKLQVLCYAVNNWKSCEVSFCKNSYVSHIRQWYWLPSAIFISAFSASKARYNFTTLDYNFFLVLIKMVQKQYSFANKISLIIRTSIPNNEVKVDSKYSLSLHSSEILRLPMLTPHH